MRIVHVRADAHGLIRSAINVQCILPHIRQRIQKILRRLCPDRLTCTAEIIHRHPALPRIHRKLAYQILVLQQIRYENHVLDIIIFRPYLPLRIVQRAFIFIIGAKLHLPLHELPLSIGHLKHGENQKKHRSHTLPGHLLFHENHASQNDQIDHRPDKPPRSSNHSPQPGHPDRKGIARYHFRT